MVTNELSAYQMFGSIESILSQTTDGITEANLRLTFVPPIVSTLPLVFV